MVALYLGGGWSNVADEVSLVIITVPINLPLLWLGLRIVRRAR